MDTDKRTLTPKLRFPEFREVVEWKEVPLVQIAERTTKKNLDGSIARVLTNSAEHGIVDQRDYFDKDIANASNLGGYYVVDIGDYVYNPRISALAPVGPISRNNIGKGVMSPLYTVFRFTDENTDFYQHYFKTTSWHLYLRRVSSMGARHDRMSIPIGDFMAMPVPTPLPQEQQKIAECLSSLDGSFAAEGRMLEALKAHKKGLMQQLFPQPGQTQPRLRFPEFLDKGEWEEKTLGKLSTIIRGGSPRPIDSYLTNDSNGLNWLKIGDVDKDAKYVCSTEEKVIREALSKTREVNPGDFILSNSMSFGRPYLLRIRTCIHDGWIAVTNITEAIHHEYLYCAIMSPRSQVFFENQAAGGGVRNLNKGIIKSLPVGYPKITEQQKIADCLSSLDTRIAAQAAKIDALKRHKRGLMQQLFPK